MYDEQLAQRIKTIHQQSRRTYGSPRVHAELHADGQHHGEKRIVRLMRGVFSSRAIAEEWIAINSLSGVLTAYPLDKGIYDWVLENRRLKPRKPITAELIAGFSLPIKSIITTATGVKK
ncbi:MAG TPA: transposase [Gemmatimonadaceae bacterium]